MKEIKNIKLGLLENIKKNKGYCKDTGITLVALVITIIVLLILAGVTLNLLLGENGLLNKAGKASDMQVAANEKEALQMVLAELEIAKSKKEIEEITAYILERKLKQNGYNVSVNSDGEVYLVTFLDSKNIYVVDRIGNVGQAERYNINYNLNGGSNPPEQPQTYQRGETVGLLYPTKEGEAFEGWYETSDFSGEKITEIRNRREDITVYANWIEETEQDYFKWSTDGTTITGLNGNTKTEIVIPKKHTLADGTTVDVTTIGANAFNGHSEIANLKMQKITIIQGYAFRNCTGLENIQIPKSITSAWTTSGYGPFSGCTNLKNVTFEEGTEKVPDNIFKTCPGSLEVTLPSSVTIIGISAFDSSGIVKLEMTNSVESENKGKISDNAFSNCKKLEEIKISNAITTIERYVFNSCTALESIEIPKSITSAWTISGYGPFSGCTNLKNVTFEEGTEKVPDNIFKTCPGSLEVTLPSSVTIIGISAFDSSGIVKLEMTNSVESENKGKISDNAFSNCKKLEEIKISNAITTIERYVFNSCTALESIEIPKSITSAWTISGYGPFSGCTNLKNVTFEEGTEKVPDNIFKTCPGSLEVTLPSSVTIIGSYAFQSSGITKITIPTSLKTINANAFGNCSSLATVNYRGDATAWSKISIAGGNDPIKNIPPIYNYID